jgi:hypothetical protein
MREKILASKGFMAYLLAVVTGLTLLLKCPFPDDDLILRLIALRQPLIFDGFKYTYDLFLFTTPYIFYSVIFSGLYIFALRPARKLKRSIVSCLRRGFTKPTS